MGGEGNPWDDSGREGQRQISHSKAWQSARRPPHRQGRRFKLDDCRVWMRLFFCAAHEVSLWTEPFAGWLTQFIAHFVAIYEITAPPYAAIDAAWADDPANMATYIADGFVMADISVGR